MDISAYKLHLIKKILEINDPQVLKIVNQVVDLHGKTGYESFPVEEQEVQQESPDDIAALQQEINDLFGNN